MVRAAALIGLLSLTGCNGYGGPTAEQRSVYADVNARNAIAAADRLSSKVDDLEEKVERQERTIELLSASLEESRGNHTHLLETFNKNVDRGNKRDLSHENDIDWLMRRNGVAR